MTMIEVAKRMVGKPRGILAMDESTGTATKRLEAVGLESTEETRRSYRQMLVTTEGLGKCISGAILFTETLAQQTDDGTGFAEALTKNDIIPGVKVDLGKDKTDTGEYVTKGLDGLAERLAEYKEQGAQFTKWRAVIVIGEGLPTAENTREDARRLAEYAKVCQQAGLVPIVEPEVLRDGEHGLERCAEVTRETLSIVFEELGKAGVSLSEMVLKPNMVTPGKDAEQVAAEEVARATVEVLRETVPADVPGIAFLSGGIGDDDVVAYLNAMNRLYSDLPWNLTFSFGRGLQREPLALYARGEYEAAQEKLLERAKASSDATVGKYNS